MERFIAFTKHFTKPYTFYLKSSMERFIASAFCCIVEVIVTFKIQYGEIYSQKNTTVEYLNLI